MKKKLSLLIVAIALPFAIAACGGNAVNTNTDPDPNSNPDPFGESDPGFQDFDNQGGLELEEGGNAENDGLNPGNPGNDDLGTGADADGYPGNEGIDQEFNPDVDVLLPGGEFDHELDPSEGGEVEAPEGQIDTDVGGLLLPEEQFDTEVNRHLLP